MTESARQSTLFAAAKELCHAAASELADARELLPTLHHRGQREAYRASLGRAIELAERAVAAAELQDASPRELAAIAAKARLTLARAHAARAEDALHGAGQLSLSAQRAPTREACDEGWRRVESIVAVAEASAQAARDRATELAQRMPASAALRGSNRAAEKAEAAARAARRLVEQRNHAYTFHADSCFSFGEGWYVAAASVLEGVAIQIEPGKDQTAQVERFLCDAGLRERCQPYRSRPRAMKQTTRIVADAFRRNASAAQHALRAAFLGVDPVAPSVRSWVDRRLQRASDAKMVLLWIRSGVHHAGRNTRAEEVHELTRRIQRAGLAAVLTGDPLHDGAVPEGAVDLILFWKDPLFQGADMRRAQLQFFEYLRMEHGLVGQLGVTTAGMDGPALLGLPTLYLTEASNVRMSEWVGAVPEYREVVREPGYLEQVSRVLEQWRDGATPAHRDR